MSADLLVDATEPLPSVLPRLVAISNVLARLTEIVHESFLIKLREYVVNNYAFGQSTRRKMEKNSTDQGWVAGFVRRMT